MTTCSIVDHFSVLEDPRQSWKVLYPLPEILLVVLCGVMAGADDFVEIERWANRKLTFLRRLLPLTAKHHGGPMLEMVVHYIWSLPGQADNGWCWDKSRALKSQMKSVQYHACWSGWN